MTDTTAFDRADRVLGYAAIAMLALVLAAVLRGHAHWGEPSAAVWGHLALVVPALALTPVMLIRRKGMRSHRVIGYVWSGLLLAIALEGFFIQPNGERTVSPIWLISLLVLVQTPRLIMRARRHDVVGHRRAARGLVIGAFLIAGVFTIPFGRMLGLWLIGG